MPVLRRPHDRHRDFRSRMHSAHLLVRPSLDRHIMSKIASTSAPQDRLFLPPALAPRVPHSLNAPLRSSRDRYWNAGRHSVIGNEPPLKPLRPPQARPITLPSPLSSQLALAKSP